MKILVILGSIRPGRNGEKVYEWLKNELESLEDVEYEFIDLKDWDLPLEIGANSPKEAKYDNAVVKKWSTKVAPADGFIIVTPEYNHGYSAVLKNALDNLYNEWNNKPVAFVSYGGLVGGSRAVEQLRLVAIELQMAPIREAVYIPLIWSAFDEGNKPKEEINLTEGVKKLIDQLLWWTKALKDARDSEI